VAFHLRDFLDRRVRDGVNDNIRERNSSMKNRKRNVALEFMWRPAPLSVCRNGKPLPDAT
jgi:hypothetical protein